jgi:PKD repeat protein
MWKMKKKLLLLVLLIATTMTFAQNYSLQFDGVDDWVETINPGPLGTSARTVSYWAKFVDSTFVGTFSYGGNGWGTAYMLGHNWWSAQTQGPIYGPTFLIEGAGITYEDNSGLDFNWHHYSFVLEEGSTNYSDIIIYIDGNLMSVVGSSANYGANLNTGSAKPIEIGRFDFNSSGYMKGYLDDVSIWNYALTQQEIQDYMSSQLNGNETDLVGYWNFNEGTGTTTYDATANGNNGTINGATWSTDVPEIMLSANFTVDNTSGYAPLTVNFTDTSTPADSIVSWQWDFDNDGTIDSNEQNPSYIYMTEGDFSVQLIVESISDADTLLMENYVTATYGPPANLTATPTLTEIELDWEPCFQPDILLYKIFRDTSPNPTTQINSTVHPDTNYVDATVAMNTTYYYRVTGYTSLGEETDYSNEVSTQLLPQMNVNPTSFDITVNAESNNTIIDSFLIDNNGGGQLEYQIAGSDTLGSGNNNYCLNFDGVNDYVEIPSINIGSEFTISFWLKANSSMTHFGDALSMGTYGLQFNVNPAGGLHIEYNLNSSNSSSGWYNDIIAPIEYDQWYYITGIYNDDYAKLYVNNELIGQEYMPNVSLNLPVWLGDRNFNSSYSYNIDGLLTDLSIWNVELNLAEIQANSNNPLAGNEDGMIGYWNFNEGAGNTLFDATSNGNDGTIYGATWLESTINTGAYSILSFNPSSGILDGGSRLTQNVIMTVNVEDLADGIYNSSADVTHNDPNETNPYIIPIIITVDRTAPNQVTGLYSTETMTNITLYWDANSTTDLIKYNIYRSIEPDTPALIDTVDSYTTTYVDINIPNEEDTYYYWISAVDENGNESLLSDSILTYLDIPATVLNVNLSFVNTDAILTWNTVSQTVYGNPIQNLTGYIVYYAEDIYEADTLFAYHGFTIDTTYTHQYVGTFSDRMFYKITAYVGDLDILRNIVADKLDLRLGELNKIIEQRNYKINMQKRRSMK